MATAKRIRARRENGDEAVLLAALDAGGLSGREQTVRERTKEQGIEAARYAEAIPSVEGERPAFLPPVPSSCRVATPGDPGRRRREAARREGPRSAEARRAKASARPSEESTEAKS